MANLALEANYRNEISKGRTHELRRQGWVTGSVFGRGAEPVSVEVDLRQLVERVKDSPSGLKSLIDLKINGAPQPSDGIVIIKGFTKDPISHKTLDIQFQRIHMQEKVHIGVPIVLVGDSIGASKAGIIEQGLNELQISCLPGHIPPKIEVDITGLDMGRHISASDLDLGSDIDILSDPDTVVVACVALRIQVVKAAAEEPQTSE